MVKRSGGCGEQKAGEKVACPLFPFSKSSVRWDMKENRVSKTLEQVVVKTVAAFLNSENGGTLLIGVDDNGRITGLEHDYKTLGKKQNRDGYENWLTTLLLGESPRTPPP